MSQPFSCDPELLQGITFPFSTNGINRVLSFVVLNNATSGRVVVTVSDPAHPGANYPAVTTPFGSS